MELYFMPMVCSLATRIALYEAGLDGETDFRRVGLMDRRTEDGTDYRAINPNGYVPALRTREGDLLTEGAAVLQYVADLAPDSGLAPLAGSAARYRLQQWLCFIGMEVHRSIGPIANPTSPDAVREFFRDSVLPPRLAHLDAELTQRAFLLEGRFTVADAYLTAMLCTLATYAPGAIDLARWPALSAYHSRMCERPSASRAIGEETAMLRAA